jgi:aconitate hydratase 2/2-methylisocitrate dehydratase
LSTSTRNFPNRLGDGANVYLCSAEMAAVGAIVGKIPNMDEYMQYASKIESMSGDVFRYLNFDRMEEFKKAEDEAKANIIPTLNIA